MKRRGSQLYCGANADIFLMQSATLQNSFERRIRVQAEGIEPLYLIRVEIIAEDDVRLAAIRRGLSPLRPGNFGGVSLRADSDWFGWDSRLEKIRTYAKCSYRKTDGNLIYVKFVFSERCRAQRL